MIAAGRRNEKITGVLVAFPITSRIPNRTKNLSWTTVQGMCSIILRKAWWQDYILAIDVEKKLITGLIRTQKNQEDKTRT